MKVAMISDLHVDSNHVNLDVELAQEAAYLRAQGIDLYLIAGDITNHFDRSLAIVSRLQRLLAPAQVRFIAGNHDMLHGVSYTQLESDLDPLYLHNKSYDLPGTDWRVIGNNGWYDYLFADNLPQRDFAAWKRAFWVDGTIEQPMSDEDRMTRVLQQVTTQFQAASRDHKKILFMTHFVPTREFIKYTADNRFWNMANALMGSPRLGELTDRFAVPIVLFGHLHRHFWPQHLGTNCYYNQAVGYHNAHVNEWYTFDFFAEWRQRLRILTLN